MQDYQQDHPPVEGLSDQNLQRAPDQNLQTTLVESDRTPRAEKPQIVATQPTPVRVEDDNEDDFFTFRPAQAHASAATSNVQASPTPSIASSSSSSRLRDAVLDVTRRLSAQFDLGVNTRPSVQRDLSHASATSMESTDSSATIVAATPRSGRPPAVTSPTFYPNQAFSALHHQQYPPIHIAPPLALRPGLFPAFPSTGTIPGSARLPGISTNNNSPAITPGLFTPSPRRSASGTPVAESGYPSPYLHHLHTQVPKETHVADIDVDPISGNKIINDYEIMDELGRGTHGKVKLGRSLKTGAYVAIKIVERFPKKRRLGRMANAEDKVKREVAILKKARHPHIVALLEVIDDPARRKVYIVLERVDMGEIPWRTPGTREIAIVEYRRYERECRGIFDDERAELEDQAIIDLGRIRRAKEARARIRARRRNEHESAWSLEFAGDMDEDSEADSASRMSSSAGDMSSPELDRILQRSTENISRAESSDLLATVTPARPSQLESDQKEMSGLTEALSGTMYGAFDDPAPEEVKPEEVRPKAHNNDMAPLRPVITEDDINADIQGLTRNLSHGDLAARAADILNCDLHPDLMYVPCMTIQAARESFRDTVLGLQYLHYQGIIHRDIKPPNLLQTKDYRTKISDFGVSYLGRPMDDGDNDEVSDAEQDFDEAKELAKNVGTAAFYAPELCFTDTDAGFEHPPIGKAIDIWALGITLFCMIFARVPFVDTEYVVMRRIAEEEVYIPSKRLRPVDNKSHGRSSSHPRHYGQPSMLRGPNALEYEELEDTLLDLLKRLLTKDVKKRATLEEIRHHPWVLEDLQDKIGWLDMSIPANTAEGKKIEISREDLETSVVPINLLDKIKSGLKKAAGSVAGLGRSSSSRKRNTSQDGSGASAASSSSALAFEGRRPSLRGDEPIVHALKASRDTEHPLSHSLTASPVTSPHPFPHSITTSLGTPRLGINTSLSGALRSGRFEDEHLNTSASTMSTTGSTRTIRPADRPSEPSYFDSSLPTSPVVPASYGSPGSANLTGLISGATRLLKTVRDKSATGRSSTPSSRSSETGDAHADPSVAISTASAEGQVNPPQVLRHFTPASSRAASPRGSRQSSAITTPDFGFRQGGFEDFNPPKDSPTAASVIRNPVFFSDNKPPTPQTRPVSRLHNGSNEADFERADDALLRRQIVEELRKQNSSPVSSDSRRDAPCPLSPDDAMDHESGLKQFDLSTDNSIPPSMVPSLGTGPASPSSSVMPLITPVSSEDRFRAQATSDTSNMSIPSVAESHHEDMLGEPLDTLAESDAIGPLPQSSMTVVTAKVNRQISLDEDEGYHGDTALDSDDDSDSSDDGGLQMMHRRPDPRQLSRSISASNAQLARQRSRRDTGDSRVSKKSSRRGSSRSAQQAVHTRADSEPDEGRGRKLSASLQAD